MSIARHHAEWLSLVEVSGPFLSLPVLLRAFPQGLPARDPELSKETKLMFADWLDGQKDRAINIGWCNFVLRSVLKFPPEVVAEGQTIPPGMEAHMSEFGEVLRPSMAILPPKGASTPKPRLLVQIVAPGQDLEKPLKEKHWKASPATRMTELLHAADVPLGLVTNGEHWMLVHAPRGETSGFASWYGPLWFEEPLTFQAFQALLSVDRFFGVPNDQTIEALLNESAKDQQEVTEQLGWQVRKAVEVLIQSLDKIDQDHNRKLLGDVSEKLLYEAALTIMMRLVFLMCAEERKILFPSDCQDYQDFYAISTLRDQLQEVADKHVEEVLDARFDAWGRLLATFRAVYGGVQHEAMRLPPYGGTLFDPDRFPFLEGRKSGTSWRTTPAEPLKVSNRTVLHLLNALQILQVKVAGGGAAEARRISFRALDIEQIGHVYEGLLDHTAKRATEPVFGLKGGKDSESEIALSKLEALRAKGVAELVEFLKAETGRSDKALKKAITGEELTDEQHLLISCGHDQELLNRVRPYAALLREDTLGYPVVIKTGSIYVTKGTDRRSTGTHYTPRSLTEPIVQHTLEPLIYTGPATGKPKTEWQLKSPREILALKVCDMTMGSGAFLVQTCRYLSERLVEAWENAEKANPGKILATPEGDFSEGDPAERIIPADPAERLAIARRYVADRCLYGVDINPMAVEMAKLSLWLITLQRDRPFTFLDHALKSGDSLLGVSSLQHIEHFSLRPGERQVTFATANLFRYVEEASVKRRALEDLPSNDHTQIETKNRLHTEAESATAKVKALANSLIALELSGLEGEVYEEARAAEADKVELLMKRDADESIRSPKSSSRNLIAYARERVCGRHPFHWPVEFPEVFARGGFDAFVGNPPFKAGRFLSRDLGLDYLKLLQRPPFRINGQADFCAAFSGRAFMLCCAHGIVGLIVTKTISEGDTRDAFVADALSTGGRLIWVVSLVWWPGNAAVVVSLMVIERSRSRTQPFLNGVPESEIDSTFSPVTSARDGPRELLESSQLVAKGVGLGSDAFVLTNCEGEPLHLTDPIHVRRYIGGSRHNSSADGWGGQYVFWFQDIAVETALNELSAGRAFLARVDGDERTGAFWKYRRSGEGMFQLLRISRFCIIRAQTSSTWAFSFWPKEDVFDQSVIVFGTNCEGLWSVLSSQIHEAWVGKFGRLMKTDTAYAPSSSFNNFPLPYQPLTQTNEQLANISRNLSSFCHTIDRARGGKTSTCNHFHDPVDGSEDIARLRALHVQMDQAVAAAYGWSDLDMGHGFHETKQGVRFTISESARRTVLDRLLALNHQRHAEEAKAGLHEKGAKRAKKVKQAKLMPTIERLQPTGFRFAVSDPAIYSVNLVVALLSEAGGSLPWQHLRDAFVFATRPDLMRQYAAPVDAQRVAAWARRWNEKALPKMLPPALKALGRKNLFIQPHGIDFVLQLPDGPKPPSSEDVGYDAWLGLRVSRGLNNVPVPLPESEGWIEDVRQLASAA